MKNTLIYLLVVFLVVPGQTWGYIDYNGYSDEYVDEQYYLSKHDLGEAWDLTKGSPNVTVAIIDDGVWIDHPDLKSSFWVNKDEIPNNNIDDDFNGYIDDVTGWNFETSSNDMTPRGTHGTLVAGIIGANHNNEIGIIGIAPQVKLMPITICTNGEGCANADVLAKALRYAADNGADVINISLGNRGTYDYFDASLTSAIEYAYRSNAIIVSAAGNGLVGIEFGQDTGEYPVSPVCNEKGDQIIGVGATDKQYIITEWSNFGSCVNMTAAGVDIISTAVPEYANDSLYARTSGTSFAAPIVSGIAALVRSQNRIASNRQVMQVIYDSTQGYQPLTIDADYALQNIGKSVDIFAVSKPEVKPGETILVYGTNFNGNNEVYLRNGAVATYIGEVSFNSSQRVSVTIPSFDIKKGTYDIEISGVLFENAFVIIEDAPKRNISYVARPERIHKLTEVTQDLNSIVIYNGRRVYTDKPSILPVGYMIKADSDPKSYLVMPDGTLRWVVSEQVANRIFGADWDSQILWLSEALVYTYTFGPYISE